MQKDKFRIDMKGITLISLVVTIVVLLILAAVSISMLTGENGIIFKVKEAKEKNKIESDIEIIKMAMSVGDIELYNGNDSAYEEFIKELQKTDPNAYIDDSAGSSIVHYNDNDYIIDWTTMEIIYDKPTEENNINFTILSGDYGITEDGKLYDLISMECLNDEDSQNLFGTKIKQISCGTNFCVALDEEGKIWTWNDYDNSLNNQNGELGNGTTIQNMNPTCLSTDLNNPLYSIVIESISANYNNVLVADASGKIWGWGKYENGLLGDTVSENKILPYCISDNNEQLKNVVIKKISLGKEHAMALDSDGKVWTWGNEKNGVLGNGEESEKINVPTCISNIDNNSLKNIKITEIAAGDKSSSCIDSEGNIWTWGIYYYNMQTDNHSNDQIVSQPQNCNNVLDNIKITKIVNKYDTLIMCSEDKKLYSFFITELGYIASGFSINEEWYDARPRQTVKEYAISNVNVLGDEWIIINNKLYPINYEFAL